MVQSLIEYEGTTVPSYMMNKRMEGLNASMAQARLPVRWGRIKKVYLPDGATDKQHVGPFYRYDVQVNAFSENEAFSSFVIYDCIMFSSFGGIADFTRYTPRLTENIDKEATDGYLGDGSYVCVFMLNGSSHGGLIMGGLQHAHGEKDDPALGHHYTHQFNGIRQEIDKDGQLTISFKGATDAVGELVSGADADASGATLTLLKDGSIKLFTGGDQSIHINHTDKSIDIVSDKAWNVTSSGTATISSTDKMEFSTQSSLAVNSMNAMDFSATAGNVNIKSLGVKIGLATDAFMKGTTYRAAEAAMNAQIIAAMAVLSSAGAALAISATALGTTAGQMATPIVGPILAIPSISLEAANTGVAAAAITAAAAQVTAAISAFEGAAPTYLSLVNNSD